MIFYMYDIITHNCHQNDSSFNFRNCHGIRFCYCKLTYCIEFTKSVYLFFPFFDQQIFVFIISEQNCCFGSLCDSGSTHSMGFQELIRYL